MGIAQKVALNFSDAVRSRGQSYFSKGRVSLISAKPHEVIAKVRGTTKYRVRARLRGGRLVTSCTCPFFNPQGEPCKHLWATLLLADSRGFLQTDPSVLIRLVAELPRRGSTPMRPASEEVDINPSHSTSMESTGTSMHMGGERLLFPPNRPTRSRGSKQRPNRFQSMTSTGKGESGWSPGTPNNRRLIGQGKGRTAVGETAHGRIVNRNGKRLLVYVLDVVSTQTHNQVVIDLARRQRKPTGEWGPLRPWWYAPQAAHVKYDPEDRLLLALLDEAHHGALAHGSYSTSSVGNGLPSATSHGLPQGISQAPSDLRGIRRFVLRKDQAGLVERLAKTGRLRLRRTEGEDDPPTMRWDDGQPWRFSLDIRTEAGGKRWVWRGGLQRGDSHMDLAEPLILLPGLLVLGVGRAARFDDLGIMPWILRLRYEKEITFVEPQQDLMLGRILAET